MYNSPEERAMIEAIAANHQVPSVVVGIGSELPANPQPGRFRQKFDIRGPFAIYVGRIDENKGCRELFAAFEEYVRNDSTRLSLVLIGNSMLPIPQHPRIRHLGFLDDGDKFDAIAASELLLMPSYFESLSMVALEAWALGRPVLANAKCDVLKGQSIRSNAGLYYDNRTEFLETLRALESNRWLSATLGRNGRQFFREHYDWPVIERKYLDMIARLAKEPAGPGIEPPPGWLARHRKDRPPAREVVAALASGPAARSEPSYPSQPPAMRRRGRPHRPRRGGSARIAATTTHTGADRSRAAHHARSGPVARDTRSPPGSGNARLRRRHRARGARDSAGPAGRGIRIGHLRRNVRADSRALDSRLPRAGRRHRTRTTCCSTTSRSDRRPRAPPSPCPIGWRSSITTSRRPSTSSACTGRSSGSAFAAGGSCARTCRGAISPSATPNSTGRISRRSAFRAPPSCRWCRTSRTSTASRTGSSPTSSTTTGRTSCSSAG